MANRNTPENTPKLVEIFKALARNRPECHEAWERLKGYDSLIPPGQDRPDKDVETQARKAWDAASRRFVRHPLLELCRMFEEYTGISRDVLMQAAERINSKIGLRPAEWEGDQPLPDLLWILPKLNELDRDGSTLAILELLHEYCSQQGFKPEEVGVLPLHKGSKRTGKKRKRKRPPRDAPTNKQFEAYALHLRGLSYSAIGAQLGISATAAGNRVKGAKAILDRGKGKSVKPKQTMPKDRREQELATHGS